MSISKYLIFTSIMILQQVLNRVNLLLNNIGYRSEKLFLSLSFYLFDRAGAPNLFAPLLYGPDDGGFWCNVFWKGFFKNRKRMAIES